MTLTASLPLSRTSDAASSGLAASPVTGQAPSGLTARPPSLPLAQTLSCCHYGPLLLVGRECHSEEPAEGPSLLRPPQPSRQSRGLSGAQRDDESGLLASTAGVRTLPTPGAGERGPRPGNRDPGCQETYLAEQVGGRPGGARGHGRRREKPTAPSLIAEGRRLGHSPRGHVQVLLDLSVLRLCTCICVFDVTTSGSVYAQKKEKQPPLCPPGPASCVGRAFSGLRFPLPRRQTSGRGGGDFTPRPGVSEKHGEASLPRWRGPPAP